MLTSTYVDTTQQTAVIETPAGVWSESLNLVYHNEIHRGRHSSRRVALLGFLTLPNLKQAFIFGTNTKSSSSNKVAPYAFAQLAGASLSKLNLKPTKTCKT